MLRPLCKATLVLNATLTILDYSKGMTQTATAFLKRSASTLATHTGSPGLDSFGLPVDVHNRLLGALGQLRRASLPSVDVTQPGEMAIVMRKLEQALLQ